MLHHIYEIGIWKLKQSKPETVLDGHIRLGISPGVNAYCTHIRNVKLTQNSN